MLQSDIKRAEDAVKYLADTATFNINLVSQFVILAKVPQVGATRAPTPTVVVDSGSGAFNTLKTAFGNAITAKRTAAQALLDSLGITEG